MTKQKDDKQSRLMLSSSHIVDRKTDNLEIKELEIVGRTRHRDRRCEEIKLKMMSVLISDKQLGVWSGTNNIPGPCVSVYGIVVWIEKCMLDTWLLS